MAAARQPKVAVVFVNDFTKEGVDRPSLTLPGDANALVSAVAKVNPRTVVVLNTGGAVLMPWLHEVRGVLEAWYPGQRDGTATAAVLTGAVDPSRRLPLTFPPFLAFPPGSGEPPEQLRAFAPVRLRPGASRTVTLTIPRSGFERWWHGRWATVPGTYEVGLGSDAGHLPIVLPTPAP